MKLINIHKLKRDIAKKTLHHITSPAGEEQLILLYEDFFVFFYSRILTRTCKIFTITLIF